MIPGFFAASAMGSGGDPHWANVVALLHFDGADESTSIVDVTGRSWTAMNDAQLDTDWAMFGPSSLLLDGTEDHIVTPDAAALEFGSGDFTIEGWCRPQTVAGNAVLMSKAMAAGGQWSIYRTGAQVGFYASSNGTTWDIVENLHLGTLTAGVPAAFAVTRIGTTIRTFMNGALGDSATSSAAIINTNASLRIGADYYAGDRFTGHFDEVRITNGVGRYSGAYTPTGPFPNGP